MKEFIEYARKKQNGVTIATPGRGSVGEIVNGMARGILDIQIQDVPYRGSTPAVSDLLKGVIDACFDAISSSIPLYQSGHLKMLAVTGRARSPGAPNVPTLLELGYKDFMLENVYSIVAPKGTPTPVVEQAQRADPPRDERTEIPRDPAGAGRRARAVDAGRTTHCDQAGLRMEC